MKSKFLIQGSLYLLITLISFGKFTSCKSSGDIEVLYSDADSVSILYKSIDTIPSYSSLSSKYESKKIITVATEQKNSSFRSMSIERKGYLFCSSDTIGVASLAMLDNNLSPKGHKLILILDEEGKELGYYEYFYTGTVQVFDNMLVLEEEDCAIRDTVDLCGNGLADFFKTCSVEDGKKLGDIIPYHESKSN